MSNILKALLAVAAVAIVAVIGLVLLGRSPSEPDGVVAAAKISDADHAAFIESAIPACQKSASANPNVVNGNIPATAIDGYCRCFAEKSADAITPDEMQAILESRSLSASFQVKSTEIARSCSADYLTQSK